MRDNRGQVLIEAAIVIPLLLLLIFGIVDFARAMYTKNTLTNAARAGARAASVDPLIKEETGVVVSASSSVTGTAIKNCLYNGVSSDVVTYDVARVPVSGAIKSGDVVQVTVTYNNFSMITPFYKIAALITKSDAPSSSTLNIAAQAAMRYE